nr:hypothetical protein B0A51_01641 [Rachicladosporium sp. CCFEE 5018]OQO31531.1 hypothetical protein B0A51_01298 [Rachicladosporium sp. CCFEE 5018]
MSSSAATSGLKRKHTIDLTQDSVSPSASSRRSIESSTPSLPAGSGMSDTTEDSLPDLAAFDPARAKYRDSALLNVKELCQLIAPYANSSVSLENIATNAGRWANDPAGLLPAKPIVGCVGGSGAGKSSTQNSMMDEADMARTGSVGNACTNIPTFYVETVSEQTLTYAAKVEYMSDAELRIFLRSQLDNYNSFTFNAQTDWSATMKLEYGNLAKTAQDTFHCILGNMVAFASPGATVETLRRSHESGDDLLENMVTCVTRQLRKLQTTGVVPCVLFETDSQEELKARLLRLTDSDHGEDTSSLWPLVAVAYVGNKASALLKHVTLLDLPGITDTNQLRVDMTHRYISRCHAMLCIVPTDRVIDNPEVERIIATYADRFPNALAVVVTKSDTGLDNNLARELIRKGQSVGDYEELCNERTALKVQITELKASCKEAKKNGKRAKTSTFEEIDELSDHLAEIERKCNVCLYDARMSWIKKQVCSDKKRHIPRNCSLEVFGISNAWYTHMQSPGDAAGVAYDTIVQPDDTGIPILRKYLRRLAAPRITTADDDLICSKIPVFYRAL